MKWKGKGNFFISSYLTDIGNLDCGESVCRGLCHALKTPSVTVTSAFYPEIGQDRKTVKNLACILVKPGTDGFLQSGAAAGHC